MDSSPRSSWRGDTCGGKSEHRDWRFGSRDGGVAAHRLHFVGTESNLHVQSYTHTARGTRTLHSLKYLRLSLQLGHEEGKRLHTEDLPARHGCD